MLLEAITAADREVYQRKRKVAEEKWKIVAEYLKAAKPTTNYSQNACRNRFEALENGTATIPPELDDSPENRRVQRATSEEIDDADFDGHGKHRKAQLLHKTSPNSDDFDFGQEDKITSDSESGTDSEGKSGLGVQLSPEGGSSRYQDRNNFNSARAKETIFSGAMAVAGASGRASFGASNTSQHNINIHSNVGTAKAQPKGVALYTHVASGNFQQRP